MKWMSCFTDVGLSGSEPAASDVEVADILFGAYERDVFRRYCRRRALCSLAVRCGDVINIELYRRATALPADVICRLPPQPEGTELLQVSGTVIRLISGSREVLDVFEV